MVIGEQDPGLDVAPVRPGIMDKAPERIIDAHGVEQRQRTRGPGFKFPEPVSDFVADFRQKRDREMPRKFCRADAGQLIALLENIGVGNVLPAWTDVELGSEFLRQRAQLFQQIGPERRGLRDGGRVATRCREFRESAPR